MLQPSLSSLFAVCQPFPPFSNINQMRRHIVFAFNDWIVHFNECDFVSLARNVYFVTFKRTRWDIVEWISASITISNIVPRMLSISLCASDMKTFSFRIDWKLLNSYLKFQHTRVLNWTLDCSLQIDPIYYVYLRFALKQRVLWMVA